MDNLITETTTLSEDIFNQLMDEVPNKSVTTKDLLGSSKEAPKEKEKEAPNNPKANPKPKLKTTQTEPEEEVQEEEFSEEDIQNSIDYLTDDEDDEDKSKGKSNPKSQDKNQGEENLEENQGGEDEYAEFFKNKALALIERGVWQEFDGIDDFNWTEESYGELAQQQAIWSAQDYFNEMMDKSGPYGQAIINHVQNGGDPSKIIELFKESKKIESIDRSTDEGKEQVLRMYYESLKWSPTKIERMVNSAIDNGTLDEDSEEAEQAIQETIKKRVETEQLKAQEYARQQAEAQENFAKNITQALREDTSLSDSERREIARSLLVYDQKLGDGRTVNQFAINFAKIQSDPSKHIKLVQFVNDMDKFLEKIGTKEEKKAAKKSWNLIKGNSALGRTTGSNYTKTSKDKNDLVIDYKAFN